MRNILKWLDVSRNHLRHYDGAALWDAPFEHNSDLLDLKRIVSKDCSRIAFKVGITDIIVDDDKLRNRSILSSHSGWVRSKGLCSFGPVKT